MNIGLILKYTTFIPWILYFIEIMLYRIGIIETHKLDYFQYCKKNLFKTINFKELLLLILFIWFIFIKNTFVLEILFSATYLYLLIDFFYTLARDCKKIKHKSLMVQTVILTCSIILFFMFTNKLYTTYLLMFGVSLVSSLIIYIFSLPIRKAL